MGLALWRGDDGGDRLLTLFLGGGCAGMARGGGGGIDEDARCFLVYVSGLIDTVLRIEALFFKSLGGGTGFNVILLI